MKAILNFKMWLYRLFKPEAPKYRKLPKPQMAVVIEGKRYWKNQLVGKSEDELRAYFNKRGVVLSPEDLTEVHMYVNNRLIKK